MATEERVAERVSQPDSDYYELRAREVMRHRPGGAEDTERPFDLRWGFYAIMLLLLAILHAIREIKTPSLGNNPDDTV